MILIRYITGHGPANPPPRLQPAIGSSGRVSSNPLAMRPTPTAAAARASTPTPPPAPRVRRASRWTWSRTCGARVDRWARHAPLWHPVLRPVLRRVTHVFYSMRSGHMFCFMGQCQTSGVLSHTVLEVVFKLIKVCATTASRPLRGHRPCGSTWPVSWCFVSCILLVFRLRGCTRDSFYPDLCMLLMRCMGYLHCPRLLEPGEARCPRALTCFMIPMWRRR